MCIYLNLSKLSSIMSRNKTPLVLCVHPGWVPVEVVTADTCWTLSSSLLILLLTSCTSSCFPRRRSAVSLPLPHAALLSVCWPPSSLLTHILRVRLFLLLPLISILPSASWRRLDRGQPGSCVLLVLRHHSHTWANLQSVCSEELQDALSLSVSTDPPASASPIYKKLHWINTHTLT